MAKENLACLLVTDGEVTLAESQKRIRLEGTALTDVSVAIKRKKEKKITRGGNYEANH
jgi:hypothetical protein